MKFVWESFGNRACLGTSFQPGGTVILHQALRLGFRFPVFTLDTGLLFDETLALKNQLERRLGIEIESVRPARSVAEQAEDVGPALWNRDPHLCCFLRKVEPMRARLASADAWITGLRRDQSRERASIQIAEEYQPDPGSARRITKFHPLARWTREDVQAYLARYDLPQNPLLARGYRSIGCQPCTRPVANPDADERAGRWSGFDKTECGIHTFVAENI